MTDHITACLATDEATTIKILTDPAGLFKHTYVETLSGFSGGDLWLNVYKSTGAPRQVGDIVLGGAKVLIHTRS